jgi:site-specific DNA-cytosine methylase
MKQLSLLFPDMRHTFADFFCGCGGLSLGFILAGLKCISAMDIAPDALSTYWYNLCYCGWSHLWVEDAESREVKRMKKCLKDGSTSNSIFPNGIPDNWLSVKEPMPCLNVFLWDIMKLEPEDWMDRCGVRTGDIGIFAGGLPCQGFSTCNTSRSVYDERNQLPLRFIRYCKVCRPEIVFMENVPGLLTLGKKKGEKEGPFIRRIRNAFDEAGYHMEYKLLNCADYGVPQNRRRVIFIAVKKSRKFGSLFAEPTHGPGKIPFVYVREAIGHLPPLHDGEEWGRDVWHVYGYNALDGYVICPACLEYNRQERTECHSCGRELSSPIRGGVVRIPGFGTLFDTKMPVDNDFLREHGNLLKK